MNEFAVRHYGTDTSGRPIYLTDFMASWWDEVVTELGFRPTIVQGAFMTRAGGGASESAGYHDLGGCLDVRTWDLTGKQKLALIRVTRSRGGASWRRDLSPLHGGMDEHCHITLGSDSPLSPGARASWASYLAGRNGLADNAPDYEWRPSPLVTTPPERDIMKSEDFDKIRAIVKEETAPVVRMLDRQRARSLAQAQRIKATLEKGHDATEAELEQLHADVSELADALAED